jgi:hypothetical protein
MGAKLAAGSGAQQGHAPRLRRQAHPAARAHAGAADGGRRRGANGRIGAVELAGFDQLLDLVAGQRFIFQQRLRQRCSLSSCALRMSVART